MTFRPPTARLTLLLLFVLVAQIILTSCQVNSEIPAVTVEVTLSGSTPVAQRTVSPTLPPASTVTPQAAATDTMDLHGQKIVFWHPWQGDLAKRVDDAVGEFNRSNEWGITAQAKSFFSAGSLYETLNTGIKDKSGDLPVVIAAPVEQLAGWSGAQGVIVDLNEYVKQSQFGLTTDEVQAYNPIFWNQNEISGFRLGLPALETAQVIFYNQTWAKELGFTSAPKTPEELKKQACEAAKINNGAGIKEKYGTGGLLIDNDALTTLSWLSAFGAKSIPEAEGQPYTFESKEGEQAITFVRGMYDQGCAWLARNPEPHDYFTRRMALFYTGTLADILIQSRFQEQAKSKDQWTLLPFPGEDGKPLIYASCYSYAVLRSDSPQKQQAGWLFARWMENPKTAASLAVALPSIPVSRPVADQFARHSTEFPWQMILPLSDAVRPAPGLASWREVRRFLEDAGWQVYHLPAEGLDRILPQTLPQLDQMVQEQLKSKP